MSGSALLTTARGGVFFRNTIFLGTLCGCQPLIQQPKAMEA